MSSDVYRPAFRTTTCPPSSSHSRTEPGPTPSLCRTIAGIEICPCAVSFEWASAISRYYHGNESVMAALQVTSPGDFTVRLIIQASLPAAAGTPSRFVLGAAPSLALECGGIVYLFFDQIRAIASAQRVAPALVLGTAVAHEIGHVLLGRRGHSAEGLMPASWKADDWQRATLGLLLFSPVEGETIRNAISSCR